MVRGVRWIQIADKNEVSNILLEMEFFFCCINLLFLFKNCSKGQNNTFSFTSQTISI